MLLKCLGENEAYVETYEVHGGACGTHQEGQKMKRLLCRIRVYWSTMLKNCIEFAKSCQECQKYSRIQHVPASELH